MIYIPTPFLLCPSAALTAAIRSAVTAPPSPERLPWKMLPALDAKAIASNKRLEQLRAERDRNRAEAERLASQRTNSLSSSPSQNRLSGGFDFSSISKETASANNTASTSSNSNATGSSGFSFSVQSSGSRRKANTDTTTRKHRTSVSENFISGNLQIDIFNHDK